MPYETGPKTTEARALDALEGLVLEDDRETVRNALAAVHALVGMDVAYLTELTEGDQVVRALVGHGEAFGIRVGARVSLDRTYCVRMLAGDIPTSIADTALEPTLATLPITRETGIRAYVGVPVRFSDGRIYGTLCCASSTPHRLRGRHARFMRVVARLVADRLEREQAGVSVRDSMGADAAVADSVVSGEGSTPENLRFNLWFAASAGAVGAARRALETLSEQLTASSLHDAQLLVTELVANSVRHAGIGPAQVVGLQAEVSRTGLRVEISDPGPGFTPGPAPPDPERESHWGLVLVESLADRWGVDTDGSTRVWFEMGPGRALGGSPATAAAA